jgi:putative copper resistance protein D
MSTGGWDVCAVAVKALLYASTLGAAGGVFYLVYCRSLLGPPDRLAVARLTLTLIAVALATSVLRIAVTAASMSGDAAGALDGGLLKMVWQGGEGRAAGIRAAGLLFAAPALWSHGRPGVLGFAGAAAAATSFAWVGHTHAVGSAAAPLLIALHLVAAAFWVGALAPLFIYARRHAPPEVALVAARFSRVALVPVSVLVVAGACVLALLLEHPSALWSSGYGRTACVKLLLVAAMLACAAVNKSVLTPRLAGEDPSAVRLLGVSITAEMILAGFILVVTAVLTTLGGPPES